VWSSWPEIVESINLGLPNKPDAANPAIAFWLHAESHWRGVVELERWANDYRPLV